jgi:hypothetical protein
MEASTSTYEASRRSTRIRAQIPLRVTTLDGTLLVSENCHTIIVNTQGCGVRLTQPLEAGVAVRLDELPTGVVIEGVVANCVPLGPKHWLVGIALQESGNIWGIYPAPPDWGSPAKAADIPAVPVDIPGKKGEWPFSQFSTRGEFHPGRK